MNFEKEQLYHIYNQGNNRQQIFFSRENYLYFIEKIKTHILPFSDILAWCLMPNHFHLMVFVNFPELTAGESHESDSFTLSEAITKGTLNDSIGVMLRSYTRAINKQENRSGSLFKLHTKALCLTKVENVTPSFFNSAYGTMINIPVPEKEYPQICFSYIHNNPVKAGLVNKPGEWEFSSFNELEGNEILINKERIKEFGLA